MVSKILVLSSLFIFSNCFCQNIELDIFGIWKNTGSSSSNGSAKTFTTKIENGEVLIFKKNGIVIRNSNDKGAYRINYDAKLNYNFLILCFKKIEKHYLIIKLADKPDTIYLNPVTDKNEIICDEGCSFTYERISN